MIAGINLTMIAGIGRTIKADSNIHMKAKIDQPIKIEKDVTIA